VTVLSTPARVALAPPGLAAVMADARAAGLGPVPFYPVAAGISVAPHDPNGMWLPGVTLHAYGALVEPEVAGRMVDSVQRRSSSGRSASGSVSL